MTEYKKGQIWNKPKDELMLQFEKETGKNAVYKGVVTGLFVYWLSQRIRYHSLICPECNKEFKSKMSLASHYKIHKVKTNEGD